MNIKEFYKRYHENYKTVLDDIHAHPRLYRGVNLRLCHKKAIFERFNHADQFRASWPFEDVEKRPRRLFPAKFKAIPGAYHDHIDTLVWKNQRIRWIYPGCLKYKPNEMVFSASKAPKLALACILDGVAYYQHEARDLEESIDGFCRLIEQFRLKEIHLDEDISPDKNALCQIASQAKIKTVVHCHGNLGIITGFLPLTADFIQVKWPEQKKKLIDWGLEPYRIIVEAK